MDPVLFGYSYDYVGDLAETVSLVWPEPGPSGAPTATPTLGEVVATAAGGEPLGRADRAGRACSTALDIAARYAHHQAGHRRPARSACRRGSPSRRWPISASVDVAEIEELWHGLTPPYATLFAWLEGQAPTSRSARPRRCSGR